MYQLGLVLGIGGCLVSLAVALIIVFIQPGGPDGTSLIPLFYGGVSPALALAGFFAASRKGRVSTSSLIRAIFAVVFTLMTLVFAWRDGNIFFLGTASFLLAVLFILALWRLVISRPTDLMAARQAYLLLTVGVALATYADLVYLALTSTAFAFFGVPSLLFFSVLLVLTVGYRDAENAESGFLILAGIGNMAVIATIATFSMGLLYLPLLVLVLVGALCLEVARRDTQHIAV